MDAASPALIAEPATSDSVTSAIAEIGVARTAFIDAIRSGDTGAVAALYDEDARLVAPAADPLRGRDDVAAFWRAGVASGIAEVELEPDDIEVLASVAWEVGRYALHLTPESAERVIDRGRYLLVYALAPGGWHRAAEMFRPDTV